MVYYIVFASSYQSAFYTVGIQTRTRDMIPVTLGSLFVNVVVQRRSRRRALLPKTVTTR